MDDTGSFAGASSIGGGRRCGGGSSNAFEDGLESVVESPNVSDRVTIVRFSSTLEVDDRGDWLCFAYLYAAGTGVCTPMRRSCVGRVGDGGPLSVEVLPGSGRLTLGFGILCLTGRCGTEPCFGDTRRFTASGSSYWGSPLGGGFGGGGSTLPGVAGFGSAYTGSPGRMASCGSEYCGGGPCGDLFRESCGSA